MSIAEAASWWSNYEYPIPDSFVTRDGLTVRTRETVWKVDINDSINWGLASSLPRQLLYPMRAYLCHVLASNSGRTAAAVFARVVRSVGKIEPSKLAAEVESGVSAGLFFTLKSWLENDPNIAHGKLDILSAFRRWYLWCSDCEFPGFDEESAMKLADRVIGGNPKGRFVLQSDPSTGPLSFTEDTRLEGAISRSSENIGEASTAELQGLVAIMLSKAYGLYSGHLELLNQDDYVNERLADGSEIYWLDLPRLKKRGRRAKVGVRRRRLTVRLARSIAQLIDRNALNYERCADIDRVTKHRPLFVREVGREGLSGTVLHGDAYRWASYDFVNAMHDFSAANRVGIPLSPRRLRYSFATRLVEEGCSPLELADALDHTDLQHVMVYFNARGRVVRQLDEGMAMRLAPFALAFNGCVVAGKQDATRANDPASVIRYKVANGEQPDVGSCGSFRHCGLNAPLACYTCIRFEPWADAPHEEVLAAMVIERRRRIVDGYDEKLIQIHDATILAVADVVRRIKATEVSDREARP